MDGVNFGVGRVAVVTGASSGIGAATAVALAGRGFRVVLGARRLDRLREVAARCGGTASPLDVTDPASVEEFVAELPKPIHLLVNNAGGALGLDPIEESRDERWRTMYETNVLGTVRVTRALLPSLVDSGDGHVINVGSTAGFETYRGGGGYTAAKHALRAMTDTLRVELLGRPVRVTEVAPGLVETEFSLVRFAGDAERAANVYRGMQPLSADDVADAVAWAATRPSHVDVDRIVLRPRDQATSTEVHRRDE
ncbi:MAG TPA: SDR family NAD(P)-dependent oxidoreductase [Thermoanaerobaculia bacterium]|nr:SDR family NAD(P)-dependent oxidoreductase [Thermoanaerobaculia bacterium]